MKILRWSRKVELLASSASSTPLPSKCYAMNRRGNNAILPQDHNQNRREENQEELPTHTLQQPPSNDPCESELNERRTFQFVQYVRFRNRPSLLERWMKMMSWIGKKHLHIPCIVTRSHWPQIWIGLNPRPSLGKAIHPQDPFLDGQASSLQWIIANRI